MAKPITFEDLSDWCADDSDVAAITIRSELEPQAGKYQPVKAPTYAPATKNGPPQTQWDKRWVESANDTRLVDAISIDNVPSQANRLEAALCTLVAELGLPEFYYDLGEGCPPQAPRHFSSFLFPHRHADAYLRDGVLDGTAFNDTPIGKSILRSGPENPEPLLEYFPQSLLFGFWQSHQLKGGPDEKIQTKLPRSWFSEVIGIEPSITKDDSIRTLGLKGDPLNLSGDAESADEVSLKNVATSERTWNGVPVEKGAKLSTIGHGQVPATQNTPLLGVSCRSIVQHSTCSFSSLRKLSCASPETSAAMRAVLVALGVAAHEQAFGGSFSLRAGADLSVTDSQWELVQPGGKRIVLESVNRSSAVSLFNDAVENAARMKLRVGAGHWKQRQLTPGKSLVGVLESCKILTTTAD